jgi:hypothetical protein
VRFVRFQEVERTQRMADMGAKQPMSAVRQQCPLCALLLARPIDALRRRYNGSGVHPVVPTGSRLQ